jgi:Tfp pilus assembly protein PilF
VGVPVSLVDVVPTLLDLVGQPPPADLDGQSLSGSVAGETSEARWFPLESEFGFNSFGWAPLTGLTDGRQKWIGAPEPELYDLVRDPGETHNQAGERPEEEGRLAGLWRERVSEDRRSPLDPASAGDAERLARLAALGYVPTTAGASREDADLPDPKRAMGDLVSLNRALGLIEAGRIPEAERTVAELVRRSPRNVSALVLLGSVRLMGGRPAEAVEPLRRATEIAPGNAQAHFNLGLALVAVDRTREAEGAWRRSLSLNPRRHDAAANLVDLLLRGKRLDDAQAVLDEARRHRIEDPMLDYLEGRLAIFRRDADGARAALNRALEGGLPEATARHARELLRRLPS